MIYISQDGIHLDPVIDFFDYHQIPHTRIILWSQEINGPKLPKGTDNLVILDSYMFCNFFAVVKFRDDLITFCHEGNKLVVIGQYDCALMFTDHKLKNQTLQLDSEIPASSVLLMLEADTSDRFYLNHLSNIKTLSYLNWHFSSRPRPADSSIYKKNAHNDYLLTMIRGRWRPHRNVLWRELNQRPGLIDKGLVSVGQRHTQKPWIGQSTHQHSNQQGHASMDLYNSCWLEIVPETCYRDLYFFTEKTHKPIMTCTPFLMVTTAGYLNWLQNQGFRTFHNLVDESYDLQYRMEDRIRRMVDVLEDIIHQGSRDFYQASKDILDHNFARLCEISGSYKWRFDQTMWRVLNDFV
jgi:hypothetical protein